MDVGVVVAFDPARGFGFIRSRAYREDVFVHASAVDGGAALREGQRVAFLAEPADQGPRATRVEPGRLGSAPARLAATGLAAALLGLTAALHALAGLGWLGASLIAVNLATWPVYALDKRRAATGGRRVPEAVLLGLALLGGSPAAALAMKVLRHKTRKPSFLLAFGAIIAVQAALVAVALRALSARAW